MARTKEELNEIIEKYYAAKEWDETGKMPDKLRKKPSANVTADKDSSKKVLNDNRDLVFKGGVFGRAGDDVLQGLYDIITRLKEIRKHFEKESLDRKCINEIIKNYDNFITFYLANYYLDTLDGITVTDFFKKDLNISFQLKTDNVTDKQRIFENYGIDVDKYSNIINNYYHDDFGYLACISKEIHDNLPTNEMRKYFTRVAGHMSLYFTTKANIDFLEDDQEGGGYDLVRAKKRHSACKTFGNVVNAMYRLTQFLG